MPETLIHYDELTRCGLIRDETGHLRYFRGDAESVKSPSSDPAQNLALDNAAPVGTVKERTRLPAVPVLSVPLRSELALPEPADNPPTGVGLRNWLGMLVSVVAIGALFFTGGEAGTRGRTPSLIQSVWGMAAAVLLAVEAIWFALGVPRWRVRALVWPIGICSGMAFWLQSCDGGKANTAQDVYVYLLGALLVAAYLLPYRRQ